jgi:hypothetical protein
MGNLTDAERANAPRPLCETMPRAVAAAINCGNSLSDIKLDRWAATYRCGVEDIRLAWDAELSRVSRHAQNQYEAPEGK